MHPNFLLSRNTLLRHCNNFYWDPVSSSAIAKVIPGRHVPYNHFIYLPSQGFPIWHLLRVFSPSNKNLTKHIVANSEKQVALQEYWQEPLDAGYKASNVRCISCFPEEPPAFQEPMINPCTWGVQR